MPLTLWSLPMILWSFSFSLSLSLSVNGPLVAGVTFSIASSLSMPHLVMVNWIAVNLDCKGWQNLQVLSSLLQSVTKLFTVSDETYIGTHRTAPVSFITHCYKFCQLLQSVTFNRTAIWLTITRGGLTSNPVHPGGDWKQKFLISYAPRGRAYWVGATVNISPVNKIF